MCPQAMGEQGAPICVGKNLFPKGVPMVEMADVAAILSLKEIRISGLYITLNSSAILRRGTEGLEENKPVLEQMVRTFWWRFPLEPS